NFRRRFRNAYPRGTRCNRHDAQASIEVVRNGVSEIASRGSYIDQPRPIDDRRFTFPVEWIEMPSEPAIGIPARCSQSDEPFKVRQNQIEYLAGLYLEHSLLEEIT